MGVLDGIVRYNDEAWQVKKEEADVKAEIAKLGEERARRAGDILDTSQDGYYNSKKCVENFEKACDIIEANHKGKYKPIFKLDHSPIHSAYADDALRAERMNVRHGGKQPKMRDGWYRKGGGRWRQSMVFEDGPHQGLPKGLREVCLERFGENAVQGKGQDSLIEMLRDQPDFKEAKPILQEAVEKKGGKLLWGVKFHPELMEIESTYRDVSKYMKERNVEGSSRGYVERVTSSHISVTVEKVRKYVLSVVRFCHLYLEGATGYNINQKIRELRKIRKCHRGATLLEVDHSKKNYNRNRF